MTVYVDDMWRSAVGRYGRMKMSHMAADSREELLEMADRVGLARKWLQNKGEWSERFDVSLSKRRLAIKHGAVEVTTREMIRTMSGGRSPAPSAHLAGRSQMELPLRRSLP